MKKACCKHKRKMYQTGGTTGDGVKKSYNPNLAGKDAAFQKWYKANTIEGQRGMPYSNKLDYDYYSFFMNGDYKNADFNIEAHFPDTYKKPTHPTFSNESIYSIPENPGGSWDGDTYLPPQNLKLRQYQTGGTTGDPEKEIIEPKAPYEDAYMEKMLHGNNPLYKRGVDYSYEDEDILKLSKGKFRGARVPRKLIDDAIDSATKAGIDPYDMLGLIGQESTFGGGLDEASRGRRGNKRELVSGWDLGQEYEPYPYDRFFGDNKVPGVTTTKTNKGVFFDLDDTGKVNDYLSKNPQLLKKYQQKLATAGFPEDFDYFTAAAKRIKTKGIGSYNPGDKKYIDKVKASKELLKADPVLAEYLLTRKNSPMLKRPKSLRGSITQFKTGGTTGGTDPETITIGGMTFPAIGLPKTKQEAAAMQTAAVKLDMANQAGLKKNRIKERKAAVAAKDNKSVPFRFPDGATKTYDKMTPREKAYVSGKALELRGRLDEDEESTVDEFNPLNILGSMAGSLGQAPYQAKRSGSITPYLTAVGAPLAVGALAGLGANTTGQFINNLANPLAGLDEPLTRMIGSPRELRTLKSTIRNRISPTEVPVLNTAEEELLSTVSNVGSIAKSGDVANNPELIRSLRKQGESLSDSQFKRLTGHSREELDQLEEFITTDDPFKANLTPEQRREALQFTTGETPQAPVEMGEEMFEHIDPTLQQRREALRNYTEPPGMGSIDLTRPANYRANRPQRTPQTLAEAEVAFEDRNRQIREQLNQVQGYDANGRPLRPLTPITPLSQEALESHMRIQEMMNHGSYPSSTVRMNDMYLRTGNPVMDKARVATNRLTNPKQSLINRLNTKLSNTLPQQEDLASENLFHALFRNADNNPAAQMKGAYQRVLNAPKGQTFKPASSLSSDSYPMSMRLSKKAVDKGLVDVNFHGYHPLNNLGFAQQAGIDPDLTLKKLNAAIVEMNKSLPGKKLPMAYKDEFGINYPDYSVTRKVLAGLSLGSAAAASSDEKEYATGGETGGDPTGTVPYRDPYYEASARLAYYKDILNNRLRAKDPKAYQQYFAGLKGTYTDPHPDKARAKYIKDSTYENYLSPEEVVGALGKKQHAEYLKALQQVNSYNIEQGLQPLYGDIEGEADLPLLNYGKRFASLQMTPSVVSTINPGTPKERKFKREYKYNPKTQRVDFTDEGDDTARPYWVRAKRAMGGNMTAGAGDAIAGGAGGLAQLLSGIITMAEGTPDYSEQPIVNASTIKNMATPYDQFATGGTKHWIQKAVNPKHKGYCTPMTKSTCTPRRKALARTFKKHHGFHKKAYGGYADDPIEVEGGEMLQTPNGMMTQVSGPKHENGGVDVNVPDGTRIYSDRLKIEGETMKQRKLNRERTMARLEKMSSARPTDRLLKNTYDRTKFQTEMEEAQDMKLMNAMNAIYNNEPMAEEMGGLMEGGEEEMQEPMMQEGGEEEMQYRYGGRKKYPWGSDGVYYEDEDPYGNGVPFTPKIGGMATSGYIPPLMGNPLTAPRIPINEGRIGLDVTNPNLMHDTGGVDMSPEIQLPGTGYHGLYLNRKAAVPKELVQPEEGPDDSDPYGISAGDYIGMAGNAFNAIAPILNTKANARATKPNINRWKGFGQRAIDTNQSSLDALETAKSEALRDIETSVGSSRLANRGSARGINTQRALDTASTLGANKARAAARLGFVNSVVGQLGQRSQLLNAQETRERMGQTAADQANAMDIDNYYSSMAGNLVNLGTNVQGIGQGFNRARERRDDIRLLKKISKVGYTGFNS